MKNIYIVCAALIIAGSVASCKKFDPVAATPKPTPIPTIDSLKIGLLAYYAFNNSTVDSSGNENNATGYNLKLAPDRLGNSNGAYYFNGTNSYLTVPDNQALRLNNTDFTLNTWVNLTHYNASAGSFLISKRGAGSNNGWGTSITGLGVNGTNILGAPFYNVSAGLDPSAIGTASLSLNKWYMITTVYNLQKKQISFYINGVLYGVTANMPTPNAAANATMYIGSDGPDTGTDGYYLNGMLDDMRIYTRVLSINDIQKLYVYTK